MKAVRWLLEADLSHLCSLKRLMFFMGPFCVGASLAFAGAATHLIFAAAPFLRSAAKLATRSPAF